MKKNYKVEVFYQKYVHSLGLKLIAGSQGLSRRIVKPEVHRPGLTLAGFLDGFVYNRILLFGIQEMQFLTQLSSSLRKKRLESILAPVTPAVILAKGCVPPKELIALCERENLPLLQVNIRATHLLSQLTFLLLEEFVPSVTVHGSLVEVFGVGVLIQGDSSVGKSESALGLIERGHRLISDDVVRIEKKEGSYLVGSGPELTRHLMEIRGIGIINVAHLYGAVCVRHEKGVDLVVKLEVWDENHFYDRVGLDEKWHNILGIDLPYHLLPVKPGRDVVLLVETIALNHRLKRMGYHSAEQFHAKLLEVMASQSRGKRRRSIQSSQGKEAS